VTARGSSPVVISERLSSLYRVPHDVSCETGSTIMLAMKDACYFTGRAPGEVAFHAYMSAGKCLGSHEVLVFDTEVHVLLT